MESPLALGIALLLAPVLPGVILKVKALFAGKTGPPLLIRWYTLIKLLRKGSVYSDSTGFVFRLGPVAGCATARLLRPTLAAGPLTNGLVFVGLLVLVYAAVGVTESITARLRMNLVPKFILTSFALVFFAIILTMELV